MNGTGWVVAAILVLLGALERWRSVRAYNRLLETARGLERDMQALKNSVMGELAQDTTWQDMVWALREERHYANEVAHNMLLQVVTLCRQAGIEPPDVPDRETARRLYFETHQRPV